MKEFNLDILIEKDKWNAPFLLAASFQNLIQFSGSFSQNGILYWQFSPKKHAQELIEKFRTKTNPSIPAKDLFEAIELFWQQVSKARNGEIDYGKPG